VTVTATKSGQTNVTCTFTATAQTGCDLGTLVDGVWSVTAKQTASGIDSAATSALSITVDATRPTVTSFSSTKSNGTYGIGTTVNITATLSEPVADGASITVTLDTGDTVVLTKATSTTLTGTYTVGTGDNSADLTVTSYALTSAPTDAVGNAMTSTALPTGASNIAGAQAIVIDTTAPTLSSATANTAGTQVTLTFNEPLNATTAVAGDFVVSAGTTSMMVSSISVSGSTVILTLGTPAAIGDVISVAYTAPTPNSATSNSAIQDIAGNDAISFTTTATVPSAPAPAPAPAPDTQPTPTATVAPAPTPTVTPTKASAPKVLECKTAVGSKKSTAPILVGEKLSNGIIFNPDSPILDSTDKRELDRVTGVMAERGGLVLVSGFARKNGFDSAEYLRNLSLARARNVSNYLVAKGVRVSMRYEGYGAVTKDIGTSIERKVELRWIDDSEKLVYEKKCLNQ
jgi:outer membrane protein OmpA-like peptidoglycan-associated protein